MSKTKSIKYNFNQFVTVIDRFLFTVKLIINISENDSTCLYIEIETM